MTWDNENIISRQAAIELIHTLYPSAPFVPMNRKRWEEKYKPYIECEKALERLPSAQPERTGRWEMVSQHGNPPTYIFRCSECGGLTFGMHKFCGECGARMKSEKE